MARFKRSGRRINQSCVTPPDDFRTKSVFPTLQDLFKDKCPFIRPNIVNGAYENVDHYLDVQFRLVREDFLSPLRETLAKMTEDNSEGNSETRNKIHIGSVRRYQNVTFRNPEVVNGQIGYVVYFDPLKKMKIKWESMKEFMFGSLLLFTNDNFKNVVFGTVLDGDLDNLKKGYVVVMLHENYQLQKLRQYNFLMIECAVYFEPYKHVMNALQSLNESSFPMKKYIVYTEKQCCLPKYVLSNPCCSYAIGKYRIAVTNENSWPGCELLGFDVSQMAAVKAALTEEFVVIQGPPGTGKTFIGLYIAKVLLRNCGIWNSNETPILVVCYTNHALDQFLEGLMNETNKILRVGGQSKSAALSQFNLNEKRKLFVNKNQRRPNYYSLMSKIMTDIKIKVNSLKELDKHLGVVSARTFQLYNILGISHVSDFGKHGLSYDVARIANWLLLGINSFHYDPKKKAESIVRETVEKEAEEDLEGLEGERVNPDTEQFDLDHITHIIEYAVDLQALERQKKQVSSQLKLCSMLPPNVSNSYVIQEEIKKYKTLQVAIQYWKSCLLENNSFNGVSQEYIERLQTMDLWSLPSNDRWLLYKYWLNALKDRLVSEISELNKQYEVYAKMHMLMNQARDLKIMQSSLVVGMTTTSAARLHSLLQVLGPKIVIVEEAAEILESHVVASLSSKSEHVILIGDHKQLRPSCAEYKLANDYKFDISLFERMVMNGMQCHCLQTQHRMRPEISKLIAPTIYPNLKNDATVYNYPQVRGVTKSLYFVEHNIPEDQVSDETTSHKNSHEADFLLALCHYLICQDYKQNEITIIATYKEQVNYMKQEQRKKNTLREVKICTVDNYQGEENKIILLSLVRSNKSATIGFLKKENRVCVALSRAREGLYIIGNMGNLVQSSKIWRKIKATLVEQGCNGPHLRLQCVVDSAHHTFVKCASDFKKVPNGVCTQLCKALLDCGHHCERICHVEDREHKIYTCKKCEKHVAENTVTELSVWHLVFALITVFIMYIFYI